MFQNLCVCSIKFSAGIFCSNRKSIFTLRQEDYVSLDQQLQEYTPSPYLFLGKDYIAKRLNKHKIPMDILENAKCMNQEISKVQLYFTTPILTNS